MKDKYKNAFQQRIEEIKLLEVSPEEKRKLAADAKNEILELYKASYIQEKEEAVRRDAVQNQGQVPQGRGVVATKNGQSATEEQDPIDNILNKLEEREERGEVGIELETPTEFMDAEALFATMHLDELFLDFDSVEDNFNFLSDDDDNDILMDADALFGGLLDEIEDEVESEVISTIFEFEENTVELEPNAAITEQALETFNQITTESQKVMSSSLNNNAPLGATSIDTEVEEVEELVEGTILDEEQVANTTADNLAGSENNELKELEKERERAQKIGAIEISLLIVLIILVIIVVYLIIGV